MSVNRKLTSIKKNFRRRGGEAMENARRKIMQNYYDDSSVSQALRYFSEVTLNNALPVFPALISMSCEAVGGKADSTIPYGEAIVLITAAADLHDDVIDNSTMKGNKQTVLGKYGSSTSILAADVLLVEGIRRLSEAGVNISKEQSSKIMKLVSDAVFEICTAEALEIQLRSNLTISPQDYYEVVRHKSVVMELAMKIGAIVGNCDPQVLEKIGQFGRSYGIFSAVIEEFADLLELDELQNRLKNECTPLPLIYALQNPVVRRSLNPLLNNKLLNEEIHSQITDIVLASKEVDELKKNLISEGKNTIKKLPYVNAKIREEFEKMLIVPLAYFE